MKEGYYQGKIMKAIEAMGGHVVNGNYTKAGEADLQCGIPINICNKKILVHVAVEVKTEKDYERVMKCVDEDYNIINSVPLKKHEPLQMAKIRQLRKKGGLALVAFNIKQVMEYITWKI